MDYLIIFQAFWFILPAYVANASAKLIGGGIPVDFGKTWKDGKRILGDGKTWRGLLFGAFMIFSYFTFSNRSLAFFK